MNSIHVQKYALNIDKTFELLFVLESLVKMTQNVCLSKEEASVYYKLTDKQKIILSEERNHYINMLTLALEKITDLKKQFICLEENPYDSSR